MTDAQQTAGRTLRRMSRIGSLQCPIIVGRDDLLDLADRRLAEVAAGRGQLLLLADRLDIARKTASAHVEHILAKLGVTRRAEIAAWTAATGRPAAATAEHHAQEAVLAGHRR